MKKVFHSFLTCICAPLSQRFLHGSTTDCSRQMLSVN